MEPGRLAVFGVKIDASMPPGGKAGPRVDPREYPGSFTAPYYAVRPSSDVREQRVALGYLGYRGPSARLPTRHILAPSTEEICRYRRQQGRTARCSRWEDTHAL